VAAGGFAAAFRAFAPGPRVGTGPVIGPPAGLIAYSGGLDGGPEIYTMWPDGTHRTRITGRGPSSAQSPFPAWYPQWSPDGAKIAFSGFDGNGEREDLFVMNADGTGLRRLTTGGGPPAIWSPNGRLTYVRCSSGSCDVVAIDPLKGTTITLESDVGPVRGLQWLPDGRMTFLSCHRSCDLVALQPGGSPSTLATNVPMRTSYRWSPDGSMLAFTRDAKTPDVWVMQADGTGLLRVTTCRPPRCTNDFDPSWTPDGGHLVFVRDGGIFTVRSDGTGLTNLSGDHAGYFGPSWQPGTLGIGLPPEPSRNQTSPTSSSLVASATGTVRVSDFPNAIAIGESGAWVSAPRNDGSGGGDVVQLDLATGEVVARIPVDHLPTWVSGGGGLAAGGGSVWALGVDRRDGELHTILERIDPAANAMAEEIDLGPGGGGDVWVDASGIWVVHFTNVPNTLEVLRLGLEDHALIARIPIPGHWSQEIFASAGSVWVSALTAGTDDSFGGPGSEHLLVRIGPSLNEVADQISCACDLGVTPSGTSIWTTDQSTDQVVLVRYDAATGARVGDPITLQEQRGSLFPDGAGGVWVLQVERSTGHSTFEHINADGELITEGQIEIDAQGLDQWPGIAKVFAPGTSVLWVVHDRDSVSRFQLTPSAG
jgi:Tol biopolymer transport system component